MDEATHFPLATPVVMSDCYMDDILSGSESIEEVIELQHQLIEMFKTTGMHLHKWCGNLPEITSNLQEYAFLESNETKALGIIWNPNLDCFLFRIEQQRPISFTKRMVLSTIARIFDPLGLLGPIITWAKIFMQRLWLLELGWNDELSFKEEKEWRRFIDSLEAVNNISIDRCIVIHRAESIELHAFSDASKRYVLSRVLLPEELRDDVLWWHGPELLLQSVYSSTVISEPTKTDDFDCELRVSERTLETSLRFIENCRSKVKKRGPLTTSEVNDAETWLIQQDQRGINLSDPSGNLKSLNIFQDDKGVLRVGGRLDKASIPYSQKHPAILDKNSKLSKNIFHNFAEVISCWSTRPTEFNNCNP
ncbi:integrase catalytic domain-containing protein [Trichonephila clavipes]|nr:integrase catalytic domain-containing protein [Trichonephila clavipes]